MKADGMGADGAADAVAEGIADEAPSAPVRRRDSAATRAGILQAARMLFTERGYDGAGVRDIARAAAVDTRLISRYFGSKEGLFAEVVAVSFEKSMMMTPEHNAAAARDLLTSGSQTTTDGLMLLLRSAANPRAVEIMREHMERNYQRRLADGLPGEDTMARSALLIAFCSGILTQRLILGSRELNGAEAERLIPLLHAALDTVAKDPSGTP